MGMALQEWPLALFTVIAPIGAGAFITLCVAFFKGSFTEGQLKAIDKLTIVPIVVALVGMLCSFAHLTNPANAMNVVNTLGTTPMGNEMLALGVVGCLAVLYWIVGIAGGLKNLSVRRAFIAVVAVAALVFACFVGLAYWIDTIPVWSTLWTPVMILGIELFGGAALGMLVIVMAGADGGLENGADNAVAGLAIVGFMLALAATIAIFAMGSGASSAVIDVAANAGSLVVFLVLFIVFAVIGVACAFVFAKIGSSQIIGWATVAVIILACFFARLVFYGMQIGVGL